MNFENTFQEFLNQRKELEIQEEEIKFEKLILKQKIEMMREYRDLKESIEELSKKASVEDGDYSRTKDKVESMNKILKKYEGIIHNDSEENKDSFTSASSNEVATTYEDVKKKLKLVELREEQFNQLFGDNKYNTYLGISGAEKIAANISRQSSSGLGLTFDENGKRVTKMTKGELDSMTSTMMLADEIAKVAEYYKSRLSMTEYVMDYLDSIVEEDF